jgi:hypothetical protein
MQGYNKEIKELKTMFKAILYTAVMLNTTAILILLEKDTAINNSIVVVLYILSLVHLAIKGQEK